MNRILWDTIFLITGSLFTFGAGQGNSIIDSGSSINANSTNAPNTSTSTTTSTTTTISTTTHIRPVKIIIAVVPTPNTSTTLFIKNQKEGLHPPQQSKASLVKCNLYSVLHKHTQTVRFTLVGDPLSLPKFVAAAVRSHFDDCPDSHNHFCFHGTCRFLILEETPACVCHPGFVGMRCEHADLLAVVATNHRQQTVATVLVLCVIGCVLTMLFCTLLHCWWRRDCQRRSHGLHYVPDKSSSMLKGGASYCPSESVV